MAAPSATAAAVPDLGPLERASDILAAARGCTYRPIPYEGVPADVLRWVEWAIRVGCAELDIHAPPTQYLERFTSAEQLSVLTDQERESLFEVDRPFVGRMSGAPRPHIQIVINRDLRAIARTTLHEIRHFEKSQQPRFPDDLREADARSYSARFDQLIAARYQEGFHGN